MLHSNRELFEQAILRTADATGIAASIIEKDYYVTEFLRRMTSYQPNMVFKGGTSLSKCYKLIQRFSEDIDLNVEDRPSEGQRKALKRNILAVVDDLGLSLSNAEEIRSRRDYNRYVINYPALQGATYLKQQLIVETVVSMRAFPNHPMDASSFIYDFLKDTGREDIIREYNLQPFSINVQAAERTLLDMLDNVLHQGFAFTPQPKASRYAMAYEGTSTLSPREFWLKLLTQKDTELLGIEVKAKSVVEIDDGLAPCFFFKTEEGYTRCQCFDADRARTNCMEGWEGYNQEDIK
jgi:hypothetical protein